MFNREQLDFLRQKASCIWWKTTEEAMLNPANIVCQIMNMGTVEEVGGLEKLFPKSLLAEVMLKSRMGQLNRKSWNFWSLRLSLKGPNDPQIPMPRKRIGQNEYISRNPSNPFVDM
jgi:hypothetical protein